MENKKKCDFCKKTTILLITCSLCHQSFCIHDRIPESHRCEKIHRYKERFQSPLEKIFTPKVEYI
jgi:predicted nucleic acid binding AN1-type Zn finger protein